MSRKSCHRSTDEKTKKDDHPQVPPATVHFSHTVHQLVINKSLQCRNVTEDSKDEGEIPESH